MMRLRTCLFGLATGLTVLALGSGDSYAARVLVSDSRGHIADVDTLTGAVSDIVDAGIAFTDVAWHGGTLYGITFGDLYAIDRASGATTHVGSLGGPTDVNSMEFDGSGTLYAMGWNRQDLYTIDVVTGMARALGTTGFTAAGDIAFDAAGRMLLSAGANTLALIDKSDPANSSAVGVHGVANLYALAFADASLFAMAGSTIYTLDPNTGAATYATAIQSGLGGDIWGATVVTTPLPSTLLLLASGLLAVIGLTRQKHCEATE